MVLSKATILAAVLSASVLAMAPVAYAENNNDNGKSADKANTAGKNNEPSMDEKEKCKDPNATDANCPAHE